MSNSDQVHVPVEESFPLTTTVGSADDHNDEPRGRKNRGTQEAPASFRNNKFHRRLAICSIICGLSCIGIKALKYSVKAEHNPQKAEILSQKAKKFSIISIVTWVSILMSVPILMALVSYLFTLQD